MDIDEAEIAEMRGSGLTVRGKAGREIRALSHPAARPDRVMSEISSGIKELVSTLKAFSQEPPVVHLQQGEVTVNPEVTINSPKKWRIEVTARDQSQKIRTMTITAAD
jgi:hypothetical protein